MAPLLILDQYYLAITFLISLALQGTLFISSFLLQTDKMTDFGGSMNFLLLAAFTLGAGKNFSARNVIASTFVMVWSVRLGGFLLFRILKTGKDGRFDEMRAHFFRFGAFWLFQLFWVWTVSLPLTILNSPALSPTEAYPNPSPKFGAGSDVAGVVLWVLGFMLEVFADQQKYSFKSSRPPKGTIADIGTWGYSRHPNFFGEILLWWALWILCLQPAIARSAAPNARSALYGSIVSPIFISLLLFFVSGLPLAEKPTAERYYLMSHGRTPVVGSDPWTEYKAYLNRTSILLPLPPSIYRRLPTIVKRTVLLDFEYFGFDEARDGPQAIEKERMKASADGLD